MSALLASATPRHIKASHRRRRRIASGHFVQRYYDQSIGRFLSVDPVTADAKKGGNFNRYWYANDNPYKFVDPDGRENVLGIVANLKDGFEGTGNAQFDQKVLSAAQRSVDLTVNAVMAGENAGRINDAKVWTVTVDPSATEQAQGGGIANTVAIPASGNDPKSISTEYSARILDHADPSKSFNLTDGLTSQGGDPSLAHVGMHELGHGSDENMAIESKATSERDVGNQVLDMARSSPDLSRGDISRTRR